MGEGDELGNEARGIENGGVLRQWERNKEEGDELKLESSVFISSSCK